MQFARGQLIVILAPFIDYEIYANIKQFDDNTLILETKTSVEIPVNSDILCIAVDGGSMFEFYTQINIKDKNLLFIRKPIINELNIIEKRNFNRIDCRINFLASPISINNKSILNSDKKFSGTILNISGGGIMAETSLNLPVGMVFGFKLKLNFFMECKVVVVRTIPTNEEGIYHYGCQFINPDLESVKAISMYTFKEQLKKKRKALNTSMMNEGGKNTSNG